MKAALKAAAMLVFVPCVTGCAVPWRSSGTTLILMPDEDGRVGAVSIMNAAGAQRIEEAFAGVTVKAASAAPTPAAPLGRDAIEKTYRDVLKAQPSRPTTFTLNFLLDSTTLTDESKALLPGILQAVRDRKPTELTVYGHADSSGTEKHNIKLSAERARVVADMLRNNDPTLDEIDVQYFGDKAPLVRSEVREPRNRRVEIVIL